MVRVGLNESTKQSDYLNKIRCPIIWLFNCSPFDLTIVNAFENIWHRLQSLYALLQLTADTSCYTKQLALRNEHPNDPANKSRPRARNVRAQRRLYA